MNFKEVIRKVDYFKEQAVRLTLKPVGWMIYPRFGIRPEFPGLNPIATALLLWKCDNYIKKSGTAIEFQSDEARVPLKGANLYTGNHYEQNDIYKAEHTAHTQAGRIIRTVLKMSLVKRGAHESQAYLDRVGDKKDATKYDPIKAFCMRGVGGIPILRDDRSSNLAAMRTCYQVLTSEQLLGIFLQSTRDEEGLLRNLELGVAKIASRPQYRDLPIRAIAFSENRAVFLDPFTYNQISNQDYGRDMTEAEFTICIADRINTGLSQKAQDDWKIRRDIEFIRLSALQKAA